MPKQKHGSASPLTIAKTKKVFAVFIKGLATAFKNEGAFRRELIATAIAIPVAIFLPLSGVEKAVMILCFFLMLTFELANTAVEALADRISDEKHELLGIAKDVGSTAVGLIKFATLIVWMLILLEHYG